MGAQGSSLEELYSFYSLYSKHKIREKFEQIQPDGLLMKRSIPQKYLPGTGFQQDRAKGAAGQVKAIVSRCTREIRSRCTRETRIRCTREIRRKVHEGDSK